MLRRLAIASLAALAFSACVSAPLRYVDGAGKEYPGTLDPATNSMTAQIGAKQYRGPFTVNDWGQAKSRLTAAGSEPLYCAFYIQVLKVKGTCTDLAGGEFTLQSR